MSSFDELYNDFFSGRNKNKDKDNDDPFERMRKLVNSLNNFNEIDSDGTNPLEEDLGVPDESYEFEENGYTYVKRVWNLEHGSVVKIEMVDSPLDIGFTPKKKLSIEDKLELAVQEERYEDAAKLRDKIKSRVEKKISGENNNNKGFPE